MISTVVIVVFLIQVMLLTIVFVSYLLAISLIIEVMISCDVFIFFVISIRLLIMILVISISIFMIIDKSFIIGVI